MSTQSEFLQLFYKRFLETINNFISLAFTNTKVWSSDFEPCKPYTNIRVEYGGGGAQELSFWRNFTEKA